MALKEGEKEETSKKEDSKIEPKNKRLVKISSTSNLAEAHQESKQGTSIKKKEEAFRTSIGP